MTHGYPFATCAATFGTLLGHPPLFVPRSLLGHPPLFVPGIPFAKRGAATLGTLLGHPPLFVPGKPFPLLQEAALDTTLADAAITPAQGRATPNPTAALSQIPHPICNEGCGHPRHPAWPPSTACAKESHSLVVSSSPPSTRLPRSGPLATHGVGDLPLPRPYYDGAVMLRFHGYRSPLMVGPAPVARISLTPLNQCPRRTT
jgi:hypothetical protein